MIEDGRTYLSRHLCYGSSLKTTRLGERRIDHSKYEPDLDYTTNMCLECTDTKGCKRGWCEKVLLKKKMFYSFSVLTHRIDARNKGIKMKEALDTFLSRYNKTTIKKLTDTFGEDYFYSGKNTLFKSMSSLPDQVLDVYKKVFDIARPEWEIYIKGKSYIAIRKDMGIALRADDKSQEITFMYLAGSDIITDELTPEINKALTIKMSNLFDEGILNEK